MQFPEEYKNRSISWGTLRSSDLWDSFKPFMEELNPDRLRVFCVNWSDVLALLDTDEDAFNYHEEGCELICEAIDILNDCAPAGFYFGAHEGDGSDFGFWFDRDCDPADYMIEYQIPEWALGAIVNGDFEGLTEDEIEAVNSFLETEHNPELVCVEGWSDEAHFTRYPDIGSDACNCYSMYAAILEVSK